MAKLSANGQNEIGRCRKVVITTEADDAGHIHAQRTTTITRAVMDSRKVLEKRTIVVTTPDDPDFTVRTNWKHIGNVKQHTTPILYLEKLLLNGYVQVNR